MGENRQHLDDLLRRRRQADRVPSVVEAWETIGVSASPLSADRQAGLVFSLRAAGLRRSSVLPEPSNVPLPKVVGEFAPPLDMLIVIGWDVDEEPAVLLSAEAFSKSVGHLRTIYPDGFLLLDQPLATALVIDFDEDDHSVIHVDRLSLVKKE